jgi:hypothetical protein
MNIAQNEKLQGLIATSPILSSQERAEWLALLELMDDKQMGELEKILWSEVGKSESRKVGLDSQVIASSPAIQSAPNISSGQMPKLSHIVNLPRISQTANQKISALETANQPISRLEAVRPPTLAQMSPGLQISEQTVKARQGSGFAAKLKSIFAEKELTTSKPEFPLELVDGKASPAASAPKPLFVLKPPSPVPSRPKVLVSPMAPIMTIPKAPLAQSRPAKPFFGAGAVRPPLKIENINLPTFKEPSRTVPAPAPVRPNLGQALALDKIEDLVLADVNILEANDFGTLVNKVRKLRDQFGYFDVVMNLEKSPAYKIYIATGLKLLTDQISFEQLADMPKTEPYMERREFEKFTDLLVKIQTA